MELIRYDMLGKTLTDVEQSLLNSIRAYFKMLDIAALYGIKMDTVALPLLGAGSQQIPYQLLLVPLINECISFLTRNPEVRSIYFIERNPAKADLVANAVRNSLRFKNSEVVIPEKEKIAFISYSSGDRAVADDLCAKLERNGIKVWYAPRKDLEMSSIALRWNISVISQAPFVM